MIISDWHQEQKPTPGDWHLTQSTLNTVYVTLAITVTRLNAIYMNHDANKLTKNKFYHDIFSL